MTKPQKLYPLKFQPISKERVWGGHRLATQYHKPFDTEKVIGESWELSGFEQDSSIIANGFLAENSIYDVIETYMDEVVGDNIFKYFGNEFPLLIKLLDIQDRLSIQVHPDDVTAFDRHNSYGKNEAWYVLDADPDACVYMGFNRDVDPNEFYQRCKDETLEEVLNVYHPKKGDFFFIESGIIHSAGGGLVIAEVQQLSDVTYRIYDWGREHNPATAREMHLDLAFDCINYSKYNPAKYFVPAAPVPNGKHSLDEKPMVLTSNHYFTISSINLRDTLHIYTDKYESFVLYFCVEGSAGISISSDKKDEYPIVKGEWILVPASMPDFYLAPLTDGTQVLEIYIAKQEEKDSYINENVSLELPDEKQFLIMENITERIDKYLWSIRVYKTRTEASDACKSGKVDVNGQEAKASKDIKEGDIISVRKGSVHYSYKVLIPIGNRQGAKAVSLYAEDLTPQSELDKLDAPFETIFVKRDRGTGRPTKKERRDIDKLLDF